MVKSRFDSLLNNKGNPLLFRSAKNLIFAMRWLLYSDSEKEQMRIWALNNVGMVHKLPPSLNMSIRAASNFIGYVDSPRLKCNCIYVMKLSAFVAGNRLHKKLVKKYEDTSLTNSQRFIHIDDGNWHNFSNRS